MKIFVWQRIDKCSQFYHPEGGVVVVAESLERAKEVALKSGAEIKDHENPIAVFDLKEKVEEVAYIMPDAGCC